jgi:hypothetical protein
MSRDVTTLNNNFKAFDVLENRQIQLTSSPNEQEFNQRKQSLISSYKDLEERCSSDNKNKEFFKYTCIATTSAHSAFLKKMQNNLKKISERVKRYARLAEGTTWEQIQA